ncbi:hypothetical protein J6590_034055 [Homalodisca vitripennis]|nr:hypothetical protein J6590_034055 [Homalodisca vitripennis]
MAQRGEVWVVNGARDNGSGGEQTFRVQELERSVLKEGFHSADIRSSKNSPFEEGNLFQKVLIPQECSQFSCLPTQYRQNHYGRVQGNKNVTARRAPAVGNLSERKSEHANWTIKGE